MTLPDGTPVSSGERGGVHIGGAGAYQPGFTHHMFLPMPPDGDGAPMGLPGLPPPDAPPAPDAAPVLVGAVAPDMPAPPAPELPPPPAPELPPPGNPGIPN